MTREEIMERRTAKGGWTKAQLAEWGVEWPPKKGWLDRLVTDAHPGEPQYAPPIPNIQTNTPHPTRIVSNAIRASANPAAFRNFMGGQA